MKKLFKHTLLILLVLGTVLSLAACGWFNRDDEPIDLSKLEGHRLADALLTESDRAMDSLNSYLLEGETSFSFTFENVEYQTTSTYTTKEMGIGTADYRTTTLTETESFVNGKKQDSTFEKHGYQNGKAYFVTLVDGAYSEICGSLSLEEYIDRVVLGSDSNEPNISSETLSNDYANASAERLEGGDIRASYSGFGQKTKDTFKETTEMLEEIYDDILLKDVRLSVLYTSDAKVKEMEIALEYGEAKWVDEDDLPKLSAKINFGSFNEDVQIDLNHEDFTDIGDLSEVYALIDIINAEKQADSGSFDYSARQSYSNTVTTETDDVEYYTNRKGGLVYQIKLRQNGNGYIQSYKSGLITLARGTEKSYGASTDRTERERLSSLIDAAELSVEKVTSIKKTVKQAETVYELTLVFNGTPAHRFASTSGISSLENCTATIRVTVKDGKLSQYIYSVSANIGNSNYNNKYSYESTCKISEPNN